MEQVLFEDKKTKLVVTCKELITTNPHLVDRNGVSYSYNKTLKGFFYYLFYKNNETEGEKLEWR